MDARAVKLDDAIEFSLHVDLGQQFAGFFLLTLLLPQPAQAHHCPSSSKLCALATRNLNGLMKIRFRFCLAVGGRRLSIFDFPTFDF